MNNDGRIWFGIDIDNETLKKSADRATEILKNIGKNIGSDPGKISKIKEALNKISLQEAKISTENARQKLLEAQAREKNAKAADIEQRTIDRLNRLKKVSQLNEAEAAVYAKKVIAAGNTQQPPVSNTSSGNTKAAKEEIAAINNLSSAYQKQLTEQQKLVEANKVAQSSFFDISETYTKNAGYLSILQKELKETQAAMHGKAGASAELSAREKQLKIDIKAVEGAMAAEYKAFVAFGGSVDELKYKLQSLKKEYAALSAAERSGTKGAAIIREVKQTSEAIKTAEGAIGGHTKKVKEYEGAMTRALKSTWSFAKYISYLIPGLGIAGLFDLAIEGLKALWQEVQKNNGALNEFKRKIEITAKALKDSGYIDAKAKVAALKNELKLATEGKISAKKAIDDYNNSLGKATGGVASLGEMERKLAQSSDAYLQMLALKTKATIAYRKAAEEGVAADIEMNEYGQFGPAFMRFLKTPSEWFKSPYPTDRNPFQVQIDYAADRRKSESLLNKLGDDYQKQAAEIAQKYKLNFFDDTKIKDDKSIANRIYQDTKQLKDLLDEIGSSKEKYQIEFGTNLESEELKINKYFDGLTKKVDEFNKDPKRKVKLTSDQINTAKSEIQSSREYALGLANDKETGDILLKQLEEQKKQYADYEDFKAQYGETAANELYKSLTAKYKTYLDRVQAEYDKLEKKGETGLNPAEANTFSKLTDVLQKADADRQSSQKEWFKKALADYASYEQRKIAITEKYQAQREQAIKGGNTVLLDGINKAEQEELKSLQASNSEKLASMEQFAEGAVYLTKKAVQQQIEILQNLLKSGDLPADVTANIQKKIEGLNKLLNGSDSGLVSSQLDKEIKKKEAALLELAKSGDTPSEAFKRLNDELMRLKQEKAENSISVITKALSVLSSLAPALNDLSSALNETNNNTAKQIGSVFASLANGAGDLLQTIEKIATEGVTAIDAIGAAANFVISTIANIVSSAQAQKKAYEEFYLSNLAYQHDYNNALIEEIRLREGIKDSVFFTDYAGKIKAGLAAEIKAVNDYNEALLKLQDAQVITGTKKVRDWAAVAGSTAAGAGAGAVIGAAGGPLSAVGAAIGAAVGFIGGMLKKRTVVNVYDGLLKTYPKLIGEQGSLNKAMAEAIISSGKIEGSSRENLQYLISMNEQYEKAKEQIEGVISDLAGSLGSDLMSSLFDDWAAGGENVGKAFADGVSKSLANIGKNLLFNAVFGDDFVSLQNKIKEGFKTTGDPNEMVSSMLEFNKEAAGKGKQYQQLLEEYARQLKQQGIDDVFGLVKDDANATRQASQKGLASMSQDTGNELNGRFTVIQSHTYQMAESLKLMSPLTEAASSISSNMAVMVQNNAAALRHLSGIETNTARLQAIESDMRAVKTGIDDINLKGIKIKT